MFHQYIYTSMATFWTYGYACSFHEEWTFLLRSRWTKVKGLYIVARYVPFLLFTTHLYMNFIPDENPDKCQMINNVCSCFSLILITHPGFFILRTWALWNNNRIVLAAMLVAFLAVGIVSVTVLFTFNGTAPFETNAIPGITGCYQPSDSVELFLPFILLFTLELGLIFLTLIRALQSWRTARNPLLTVLLKHNVFYYACGLFFSALNVLTSLLLTDAYTNMFQDFQIVILAILATHMHLHLWHADRIIHGSDAIVLIPLSNSSASHNIMVAMPGTGPP
ncbi:hypothetical protein AZE42_00901 [Rhizopogon vesiculosus]|uniref:DUF6533 domain-containing protein n=1 Tax=Rhizopogon vesiculosus TaxID=180088 RepID=A0A1J8R5J8_9AGAM|nr:hypothetical protein AZE42_00901 [Rhizopogon vesiculosus]